MEGRRSIADWELLGSRDAEYERSHPQFPQLAPPSCPSNPLTQPPWWEELTNPKLRKPKLRNAKLRDAKLRNAKLRDANVEKGQD